MKRKSKLQKIGHELKKNPPRILAKTAKKSGKAQAEKQRAAILLSKGRKAGVRVPKNKGKKAYMTYE